MVLPAVVLGAFAETAVARAWILPLAVVGTRKVSDRVRRAPRARSPTRQVTVSLR